MMTVGFLVARLHLHVFDRIFLAQGRIARLLGQKHGAGVPADPFGAAEIAVRRQIQS
jgi:hypothetical protein